MLSRPPAADPVAEAGHGDEQAGQDDPVRVDDPQQLGPSWGRRSAARVGSATLSSVASMAIEQQARREDGQDEPAVRVRASCPAPS
jgi:hypothetical protein